MNRPSGAPACGRSAGEGHTGGAFFGGTGAPGVVGDELHPGVIFVVVSIGVAAARSGPNRHVRRWGLVLLAVAAAGKKLPAGALQQRHAALPLLQLLHLGADGVLLEHPAQRVGVLADHDSSTEKQIKQDPFDIHISCDLLKLYAHTDA